MPVSVGREGSLDAKHRIPYVRLALGLACVAAGIVAGQAVDQRLMLVAMFPAVALLSGVISHLTAPRPPIAEPQTTPLSAIERELLAVVWNTGDIDAPEAARRTSLTEPEAAETLSGLADRGYLEAKEADGVAVYGRASNKSI
jgi:hypothetical protein